MRTTYALITMVLAMLVCATVGVAQVVTERPAVGQVRMLVVSLQDIDLTDEQEAQIAAIRKEYRSKIEENSKELKTLAKEEVDQIRNVLSPEQKAKSQAIIAERKEFKEESLAHTLASLKELDLTEAELAKIAEIRKEFRSKTDETVKQLEGLLNDAQKKARDEAIKA